MTRLYLISPPIINLPMFAHVLEEAFLGGDAASFQLRLKGASDADILKAAEALIPICHAHNAAFILNDRPDLALKCHADGVHIGQDDGNIKDIRAQVGPGMVIGASCHDSRHLAMVAGENGADYVAFGAFYPTKSKNPESLKKWGVPTPEILDWWQSTTVLPCVAIGGITPANCTPLVRAGADFIAVITAVWEHPSGPAKAVEEFNAAIESINMKIDGSAVRMGMVIEWQDKLWLVVKHEIRTPGNLRSFNQVELKDIKSGTKNTPRFSSAEKVERVSLDSKKYNFLYADGDVLNFMDNETYEQITMNKDMLGERFAFLQDGMTIEIETYEGTPLSVKLPSKVTLKIVEADPVVRGQTAASSYKPAILENGVRVMVPPFIAAGESIVVDTSSLEYVERAKAS